MNDKDFQKHHLPKPCKFCGRGASYAPLAEMDKYGADVYFCHPCQAEYVFWSRTEDFNSVSLYTTLNGKMYRLQYQADNVAVLSHIKTPGEPGTRVNKDIERIKVFSYHPEATPENVNEKIKTWLVYI